jgi:hypothetical protein
VNQVKANIVYWTGQVILRTEIETEFHNDVTRKKLRDFLSFAHICVPKYLFLLPQIKMIIYFIILPIQGVSGGILNILGGCSIDYSE